jgi:signal transduction histidine kinase
MHIVKGDLAQRMRRYGGIILVLASFFLTISIATPQSVHPKLQSIESAIQDARSHNGAFPVVVRGIVVLNYRRVVIEDRTGAIEVTPSQPSQIALGDEVEVTGTMTLTPRPKVREGRLVRLWGGSMPLPLAITPDEAAEGENELSLVQMDGQLISVASAGLTGVQLNLSGEHQNFSAILPNSDLSGDIPSKLLQPGAKLQLTGILFLHRNAAENYDDVFSLQLRSPDDLALLEGPSWWSPVHLLFLAGVAMILVLFSLNVYERINHSRYRAIAEERANIARDIHDTLAQGFAGISLQLEAAERTIDRSPGQAKQFLKEALQLVRHSRDESHLSIEILRSPSRSDRLDLLLAHCIAHMQATTGAKIEQQIIGDPPLLPYNLVNNIFRIGQEAIANAVRHANAGNVLVQVHYEPKQVRLQVDDDGVGFDPEKALGPDEGHFGLTGMRERAAAMNGKLKIESTSGRTEIGVVVSI